MARAICAIFEQAAASERPTATARSGPLVPLCRAPQRLRRRRLERAPQQLDQPAAPRRAEPAEHVVLDLKHQLAPAVEDAAARRGDRDLAGPAVGGRRPPLREPRALELVDQ